MSTDLPKPTPRNALRQEFFEETQAFGIDADTGLPTGYIEWLEKKLYDSKDEFDRLTRRDDKLAALENGGVDNWEWYGDSIRNYREENSLPDDYFDRT